MPSYICYNHFAWGMLYATFEKNWVHNGIHSRFHWCHGCSLNWLLKSIGNANMFILWEGKSVRCTITDRISRGWHHCYGMVEDKECTEHESFSTIASILFVCAFMLPQDNCLAKVGCPGGGSVYWSWVFWGWHMRVLLHFVGEVIHT